MLINLLVKTFSYPCCLINISVDTNETGQSTKRKQTNTEIFPFHPPPHIHRERGLNKQYWIRIGCLILWVMMGICFLMTVGLRTRVWHPERNYRHSVFLLHTIIKITVQITVQWKPSVVILHFKISLKSQFFYYKALSSHHLFCMSLEAKSGVCVSSDNEILNFESQIYWIGQCVVILVPKIICTQSGMFRGRHSVIVLLILSGVLCWFSPFIQSSRWWLKLQPMSCS